MGKLIEDSAAAGTNPDLLSTFEYFNTRGYAFVAIPHGFFGWLLRRIWIIPLGILAITLLVDLAAFNQIGFAQIAVDLTSLRINNAGKSYRIGRDRFYRTDKDVYYAGCELDDRTGQWTIPYPKELLAPEITDQTIHCVSWDVWNSAFLFDDTFVYLIPIFSIMLCASILYSLFIHRAPRAFYQLAKSNRLIIRGAPTVKPRQLQPKSSQTFVHDLESALQGTQGKRFMFACFLLIVILVIIFAIQRKSLDLIQGGFLPISVGETILIFIIPVVGGLLFGLCIWVILVVGMYLGWLTATFELNIQPYHPDGCGGLKPVGNIALMMALITIVPGILLSIWAFRGLLGRSIPAVTYLTFSLLVIIFSLSLVSFLLPVIRVHREMARRKKVFQVNDLENATIRLEQVKNRLRELVSRGDDRGAEGQELKYQLELLEKLYPEGRVFITWPFGYAAIVTFVVGQAIQFIPLVAGWISGIFKGLWTGAGAP